MKRTGQQCVQVAYYNATQAIQKAAGHKVFIFVQQVVSVFSFSDFKAKAFRFCLFFCTKCHCEEPKGDAAIHNILHGLLRYARNDNVMHEFS